METIKVNMTPCDDVQTIHASQNDNEARKWEFELHNNGEVIDAGGITDQIVFKTSEGGTEELLPSSLMNGSVDLGSLTWTYMPNNYFRSSAVISDAKIPSNENTIANIFCSILKQNTANNVYANNEGIAIDGSGRIRVYYDDMPTDAAAFTQAMQGVMLWYEKSDSTPATTPIDADIKYPQGLLTNQEFTYRKSPTEEDGLANIVGIKGQTLKWNQFCCKERYFTRSINEWQGTYTGNGVTFTYLDDYTVRITGTPTARTYIYVNRLDSSANYPAKPGDKLLLRCSNVPNGIDIFSSFYYDNTWKGAGPQKSNKYVTVPSDVNKLVCMGLDVQASLIGQTIDVTVKLNVFNLTQMFGSGNEPTEEEFNALFPFYYPYNSGSLIPFNGNGIKTTGKNLFQNNAANKTQLGIAFTINDDKSITVNGTATGVAYITHAQGFSAPNIKKGESLILSGSLNLPQSKAYFQLAYKGASTGTTYSFVSTNASSVSINATEDMTLSGIYFNIASGATVNNLTAYPMLRYADTDPTYEPYKESLLNLPISTYFPTGMKQAGNVYDELIPTKATTRMRGVDLGTLTFNQSSNFYYRQNSQDLGIKADAVVSFIAVDSNITSVYYYSNSGQFRVYVNDISIAPSGMLYYELAIPTETSFTTASLVTENGEVALANENGVLVGKCNSDVSADAGFIEGKIKLSDSDGDVYSNKIQIHVERSPQ